MTTIEKLCSVCTTRHHDFVIFGARCIAVRDRTSGEWLEDHHAIDERVALVPTRRHGEALGPWDLVVHAFGFQIQVGPVVEVGKPNDQVVAHVSSLRHLELASSATIDASAFGFAT